MRQRNDVLAALLTSTVLCLSGPTLAAEVTPDRLINADKEPHNWLMNHRTYDAQRYSPLDKINKTNVKSLKLAYAVALGGTSANENLQSTPLAEDGYLYVVDQWGVLYKIDGRSGIVGQRMPLNGPYLSDGQIVIISRWIGLSCQPFLISSVAR